MALHQPSILLNLQLFRLYSLGKYVEKRLGNSKMTVPQRKVKPVRPPFPLDARYPSTLGRWTTQFYNSTFNRLYPVKPWVFATTTAGSFVYYTKFPKAWILTAIPDISKSELARFAKIGLVSLLTAYLPVFLLRRFLRHFYFSYKGFLFENPKNPSWKTKFWAICHQILKVLAPPRLNSTDALLPPQPVPALKETIEEYLNTVEPILSKDEFDAVKFLAKKFLHEEGPKLQVYVTLYSYFTDNYVTPFWEKYAYLYGREPLLISSSVAHVDLIEDRPANQAVRAAHVVYIEALSMLAFYNQTLKPLGDGMVCSTHYKKMYATTRIPGETMDHLDNYQISRHVIAFHKGCFYKIEVFDKNNKILSLEKLSEIFIDLLRRNDEAHPVEAKLASLTHDRREQWHKNRREFFLKNKINKVALETIEKAMFFIVLDDAEDYGYVPENPEILDNFMKNMLTGNGANRWVDKSLNYIVARNGRAGGTTEHSIADGAEFDHIMENFIVMDDKILEYPKVVEDIYKLENFSPSKDLKLAERINFDITEDMKPEILRCYDMHQTRKDDLIMAAMVFRDFGKGIIKKGKCSPDAFMQMAIQLANYKDQGKFVLTYESASSRFFTNSRTETLRTVSKDSCAFVNSMLDENSNDQERLKLLRQACESHGVRNRNCMVGKGVDRHLFVLYLMSRGFNISSPFLDHYIAQPWLLSTSQPPNVTRTVDEDTVPERAWIGACFGPVAKNGYGICYRFLGDHSISANISSFKSAGNTDADRFRNHLIDSIHQMAKLFEVEGVKY